MATDLFANNAQTTLAAGIAAGAVSLTVASSTPFPAVTTAATTQFRIIIDAELFIVTNVTGLTWTVTPGAEGTTQAAHANGATVTALLTAGALAKVSTGLDSATFSTHGVTPLNTRYTRAALAAARLGLRDVRLIVQGDSMCNGLGLTTPAADNFIRRAAQSLATRLGLTARRGLVSVRYYGVTDPQWVVGSGWSAANITVPGSPGSSGLNTCDAFTAAVGNTPSLDFTPVDDAGSSVQTDSFIIYAYAGGTSGPFQYAIDGGGYTAVTNTNVNGQGYNAYTVSAGALGAHVLHVKSAATGNAAYILGAEAVNSTARGVRWFGLGANGVNTPTGGLNAADLTFHKSYAPDLVIFQYGTNDYLNQVALSTFQANVLACAANPATYPKVADVMWTTSTPQQQSLTIPNQTYINAIDAASDAGGFGVFHLDRVIGSYAVGNVAPLSLYYDGIHPNATGHSLWGDSLAAMLAAG